MTRPPPLFRRSFAAICAVAVMLAPASQLAHARGMAREAVEDCVASPAHHHSVQMPAPHRSHHQHAATCCDLCPTGCETVVAPPTAVAFAPTAASSAWAPMPLQHDVPVVRQPHILPFSLPPPSISV